jgi:hypothetical protein
MEKLLVRQQQATGNRNSTFFSIIYETSTKHVSDLIVRAIAKFTLVLQFPKRIDDLRNATS